VQYVQCRRRLLELAEPGAEFQVTDVIVKPNLPIRRLILSRCSSDHCVVYYERGGIAHTFSVVLFRIDKGGAAQFEWGSRSWPTARSRVACRIGER
jgi:hypothetical protein